MNDVARRILHRRDPRRGSQRPWVGKRYLRRAFGDIERPVINNHPEIDTTHVASACHQFKRPCSAFRGTSGANAVVDAKAETKRVKQGPARGQEKKISQPG